MTDIEKSLNYNTDFEAPKNILYRFATCGWWLVYIDAHKKLSI